ncbi:hypothetical protein JTE90_008524 [Oedothorax gibbosus]|uniref:DUF5641 domain-containing protein n=1 Tax=Oedothorax gibbosus TaxID=931172 RepID=A0AAV6VGB2_9ARAC|nr:hypothetical protein JTE90_008524 [Oedothorax gibbosus]
MTFGKDASWTFKTFKLGDVVLIGDKRCPRNMWPIAMVEEVCFGRRRKGPIMLDQDSIRQAQTTNSTSVQYGTF